jgi:hypothetical protein
VERGASEVGSRKIAKRRHEQGTHLPWGKSREELGASRGVKYQQPQRTEVGP